MVRPRRNTQEQTRPRGRRLANSNRGQSLVEFAFVVPILFILVFGIIDFGVGLHSWITVTNAAREGARLGAVHGTQAEVIARVHERASNLDQASLDVLVTNAEGDPGQPVRVQVDYEYDLITPLGSILHMPSLDMSAKSEMRIE
ncbi:MAG: TadE family protein [Dehalococcoidia bacterium]